MRTRTEIINNRIVNNVEQLARFLKHGDIFRKMRGNTVYLFKELVEDKKLVICENLETHAAEEIYFSSPVYRLLVI